MFTWLKDILGITSKREEAFAPEPLVLQPEQRVEEPPKPKKKAAAKSKKETIDLDSLSKTQLLAEAKRRGVKANASLKREVILDRIKSA